jgi:hypothetical protein
MPGMVLFRAFRFFQAYFLSSYSVPIRPVRMNFALGNRYDIIRIRALDKGEIEKNIKNQKVNIKTIV